MAKLTAEQKKKNQCQRYVQRFKGIYLSRAVDEVARDFQKLVKLYYARDDGSLECYTCEKSMRINTKEAQGGHYKSRGNKSTIFDSDNVRPQCSQCNDPQIGGGRPEVFRQRLILEIGIERVEELERRASQVKKWTIEELADLKYEIKKKIKIEEKRFK